MITGKIYRSPEEWTALLTTPEVLAWERKVEKVRHEAAQTFQSSEGMFADQYFGERDSHCSDAVRKDPEVARLHLAALLSQLPGRIRAVLEGRHFSPAQDRDELRVALVAIKDAEDHLRKVE